MAVGDSFRLGHVLSIGAIRKTKKSRSKKLFQKCGIFPMDAPISQWDSSHNKTSYMIVLDYNTSSILLLPWCLSSLPILCDNIMFIVDKSSQRSYCFSWRYDMMTLEVFVYKYSIKTTIASYIFAIDYLHFVTALQGQTTHDVFIKIQVE